MLLIWFLVAAILLGVVELSGSLLELDPDRLSSLRLGWGVAIGVLF